MSGGVQRSHICELLLKLRQVIYSLLCHLSLLMRLHQAELFSPPVLPEHQVNVFLGRFAPALC